MSEQMTCPECGANTQIVQTDEGSKRTCWFLTCGWVEE